MMATQLYTEFQPLLKVDDEIKSKAAELTAGATTPEEETR